MVKDRSSKREVQVKEIKMRKFDKEIPADIRDRFAQVCAEFKMKYNIDYGDIVNFVLDIIGIYDDYIETENEKGDKAAV